VIRSSGAFLSLHGLELPRVGSTRTATDVAISATGKPYTEGSMDERKYLTADEVSERYRGSVSVGTLRNWRAMKVGPTFVKIGKAVLYPIDELEAWDRKNMVTCRASKRLTTDARDEA
jgi:hypothetical protein